MDLTDKLSLIQLTPYDDQKLSEIDKTEIINEEIDQEFEHDNDKFSFGIEAKADASVKVLNDAADDDGDELAKLLNYDDLLNNNAVINYSLMADLQAKVGFEVPFFKLGLNPGQKVIFNNYELHTRDTKLKDAVIKDLKDFKLFIDQDHVLKLQQNEAMAMSLAGQLNLEAEASWSDTITSSISSITKLLNLNDTLQLKVETGVKLGLSLKIEDTFQAIVKRTTDDRYWVKLSKAIERSTIPSLGIGVSIVIGNPEVIDEFIDEILNSVEDDLGNALNEILGKIESEVSEEDLDLLIRAV